MEKDEELFDKVIPDLTDKNFGKHLNYDEYQEDNASSEAFPNDYTLAILANLAYNDKDPIPIPKYLKDWKVLTKASNKKATNGYRGVLFFNPKNCHVVIAHRGTGWLLGAGLADLQLVLTWFKHKQAQSAASFAYLVAQEIKRVNTENNYKKPPFQLTITGHSLGAWLAQYTTFTVKYLTLNADETKFIRDDNYLSNIHPHTVVFESPGCKETFEMLVSKLIHRYANRKYGNYNRLDMTVYINEPNPVNCIKGQIGFIYKLPIDGHSINSVIDYLAKGEMNKEIVLDMKYGIVSSSQQLFKCSLTAASESELFIGWYRVNYFFKYFFLTFSNYFNMIVNSNVQRELKTIPAKDDTCSLNVFTESEGEFVIDWYRMNKIQDLYNSTSITNFRNKYNIPKFEICREYNLLQGKGEDIKKVIRIVKNLPPNEQIIFKMLNDDQVCTYFVEWYEAKLEFNGYYFNDKYGLLNFLTADEKILHVRVDFDLLIEYDFEINCIGNVITYYQKVQKVPTFDLSKEKIAFIDWNKLRKFIDNSWNFPNNYNLLVVEYYVENENENGTVLEFLLKNGIKKVIILSNIISFWDPSNVMEMNGFGGMLTFRDLNVESQRKLLNTQVFMLNNQPRSLNDLFKNITNGNEIFMSKVQEVSVLELILADESKPIVLDSHYNNLLKSVLFYDLYCEIQENQVLLNLGESMVFILHEDENRVDLSKVFSNYKHLVYIKSIEEYEQQCFENTDHTIKKYLVTTKNGKIFLTSIFNYNFYIHRSIIHKRRVNPDIFKNIEDVLDSYIFYGDKKKYDERSANIASEHEDRFKFTFSVDADLKSAQLSETNVHAFEINKNGTIYWRKSCGSVNSLQKYMHKEEVSIKEYYETINDDQIIILSGEPGIGKSSVFEYLYLTLQSKYWIFPIQLKNCSFNGISIEPSKITYDDIAKFITKNCSYDATPIQDILSIYLQCKSEVVPIFLLMDSFDSIGHEEQDKRKKVMNVINFLKLNSNVKILITTGSHLANDLENGISVFSSSFKQLNYETEIVIFLVNFWKSHLCLFERNIDEVKLKSIAENMLETAKSTIGENVTTFIENPMNMRLLAETMTPDTNEMSQFSDLLMLYKKYINQRCDIYFKRFSLDPHQTVKKWLIESILGKISALSINRVLNVDIQQNTNEEINEFYKVGLVYSDSNNLNYKFLHDSVCDYFISDSIKQWLTSQRYILFVEYDVGNFLISELFSNEVLQKVRLFLNFHLKTISITPNRIDLCKDKLVKMLKDNDNLLFNDKQESIFHICIKENLIYILQFFLLKLLDSSNAKIILTEFNNRSETPLYYAIAKTNEHDNPKHAINCLSILLNFLNDLKATADVKKIFIATLFQYFVSDKDLSKLNSYIENFEKLETIFNEIRLKLPFIKKYFNACKENNLQSLGEILAEFGNDEMMKDYPFKLTNHLKETGIHLTSNIDVAKILIQPSNINLRDHHGMTPLCCSIKQKRNEIAKLLIEKGASYEGDNFGGSALIHAAKNNLPDIVKMILEPSTGRIADVNECNHFKITALMMAARHGNQEIVNYLINQNANIHLRDSNGVTAFYFAVKGKHVGIVETLKNNESFESSDINTQDRHGTTPLLCSIKQNDCPMIYKLLSYGADASIGNNREEYPLQCLIKEKLRNPGNKEVDKYIKMLVNGEFTTPAETKMLSEEENNCMQEVLNK